LYSSSLWGTGQVAQYIIERVRRAVAHPDLRIVPVSARSHEAMMAFSDLGERGRRAAHLVPFEIHVTTLGVLCAALLLMSIGPLPSTYKFMFLVSAVVISVVTIAQWLLLLVRWVRTASERESEDDDTELSRATIPPVWR
jgi:hypothetical protein